MPRSRALASPNALVGFRAGLKLRRRRAARRHRRGVDDFSRLRARARRAAHHRHAVSHHADQHAGAQGAAAAGAVFLRAAAGSAWPRAGRERELAGRARAFSRTSSMASRFSTTCSSSCILHIHKVMLLSETTSLLLLLHAQRARSHAKMRACEPPPPASQGEDERGTP